MLKDKKKLIILIGILLTVLVIGGVLIGSRKAEKEEEIESNLLPTEVAIPTVDKSVKVNLVSSSQGKEVVLMINGIPKGTESVDYELSYQTAQQGLQGVIGTVTLTANESKIEKNLTLGTCSSGNCVYHQVAGKIRLNLRFTGEYGDKVFEKEYEL